MPEPYNPRNFDHEPWPLDAGLIPFALRIAETTIEATVEDFFAARS